MVASLVRGLRERKDQRDILYIVTCEIINGKQDGEDFRVIVMFLKFLREVVRSDWIVQYYKWYIFERKRINVVV